MVSAMVIGIDESRDLGFKVLFEEEVFQQDAVLQRLVPALDIALRLRMAETLAAWKPVGDLVIDYIRGDDVAVRAKLNGKSDGFDQRRWRDPVAFVIAYFDLMIRSAFSQDIKDHVWLAKPFYW